MNYIEGITLKQYLESKGGKLSVDEAIKIMLPVVNALQAIHSAGMLHRDISPDNIYISKNDTIKLLDFGAARYTVSEQTNSLSILLKHGYAPVEQYQSRGNQGPWTDIYAVAATIYKLITSQVPPQALDRLEEDTLVPPSKLGIKISAELERVLTKALSIRIANRYQNVEDFKSDITSLKSFTSNPEPTAKKELPVKEATKLPNKKIIVIASISFAFILVLVFFIANYMAQQKSMAAYKSIINQLANKSNVSVADNKNPANSKVSDTTKITADADAKSKADADAKAKAASDKAKADADTKAKAEADAKAKADGESKAKAAAAAKTSVDAAAKAKADAAAKAKAGAKAKAKAEAAAKAKIAAAAKAKADAAAKAKLVAAAKAKAEAARIASIKDKAIKAIAFIKKQTYDREKNNAFNETLLKVKDIQNAQNLKGKITLNQSDVNSAYAKISEGAPGYFYYTLHNGVGDKGRLTIVKALYNLYKTKYITLTPDAIENYNNIFK